MKVNFRPQLGRVRQLTNIVPNPVSPLMNMLDKAASGRKHRRIWQGNGRAHIEVKAVHTPGFEHVANDIEKSLKELKGVDWAEVNAVAGRVVVAFADGGEVNVDDLVEVIEGVEEAHDVHNERFPHERPEHPGDSEPINRNLLALGADAAGIGAGLAGQVFRLTPIPTELSALVSFVQNEPRLRRILENRIGHGLADVSLGILDAVGQGLSQGSLGLFVDAANRTNSLAELISRQRTWSKFEPLVASKKGTSRTDPIEHIPRSRPLRSGSIEKYADRVSIASFGGFAVALGVTRDPRKSANMLVASLPKAARMGREAYASHLCRVLSGRGALVMDATLLRRLDRMDVALFDSDILRTGRWHLESLEPITDADINSATREAVSLFDPTDPKKIKTRREWKLGPILASSKEIIPEVRPKAKEMSAKPAVLLGIWHKGLLKGVCRVIPELVPSAPALVKAAQSAGLKVEITGKRQGVAELLGIEHSVESGVSLTKSVRALQANQSGVLLVAKGNHHSALRLADGGIGVIGPNGEMPWAADIICNPELDEVYLCLEGIRVAKEVSKKSVALAALGSGVGGTWAMIGPSSSAGRRAVLPVNIAALSAQIYALMQGMLLERTSMPNPPSSVPWHAMDAKDVLAALGTKKSGLSAQKALQRQSKDLPPEPNVANKLVRAVAEELMNPMTPLLAVGAGLSAAVGSVTDAALVAGVTSANALIGGVQKLRTAASLSKLILATSSTATVRRGDEKIEILSSQVVVGDVVELSDGDVVPADCRILEAENCEIDESSLTGESLPVSKSESATAALSVGDRTSMLYEGTTVVAGRVVGVVVATGDATEIGRVLCGIPEPPISGVEARLTSLMKATVPLTVGSGVIVTTLGLVWRRPVKEAVTSGVSLMVASVPEGLPMLASLAQLASAQRLSKVGALVRHPKTIEALGRVDVLCFDKTGTLTAGKIELKQISNGRSSVGLSKGLKGDLLSVLVAALRASPAKENGDPLPHATDRAIVEGASGVGVSVDSGLSSRSNSVWEQIGVLGFESSRGFHAVVGKIGKGKNKLVVKGAPEVIIPRCTTWKSPEGIVSLDRKILGTLHKEVERLASSGLRVLAVAERESSSNAVIESERVGEMNLLGFVGLADSVRPTAGEAVSQLRRAGVNIAMITGDHPATARSIAIELGILNGGQVLTGVEIDALNDDDLDTVVRSTTVFARVSPSHKVRIVESLKRAGAVVAMTGDGANDAAAIRLANVGIALGKNGSRAACDAADLVVTDDRLETIIEAIVEGRAMWASVRDALGILIGGNVGEVAFTVASTAMTGRSALNTKQLLLVNLMTDLLPALTIALRPPANLTPEELLNEGPESSLGSSLARQIALRATTTSLATTGAWMIGRTTGTRTRASTIALSTLVGTQLAQTAALGHGSPIVLASTAASAGLLCVVVQTPGISQYFGCTPLDPFAWVLVGSSTAIASGASIALPWAYKRYISFTKD